MDAGDFASGKDPFLDGFMGGEVIPKGKQPMEIVFKMLPRESFGVLLFFDDRLFRFFEVGLFPDEEAIFFDLGFFSFFFHIRFLNIKQKDKKKSDFNHFPIFVVSLFGEIGVRIMEADVLDDLPEDL